MNSMNATPLVGAFCFPCPLLCFSMFDELIAEKHKNGSEKSGNYKQGWQKNCSLRTENYQLCL